MSGPQGRRGLVRLPVVASVVVAVLLSASVAAASSMLIVLRPFASHDQALTVPKVQPSLSVSPTATATAGETITATASLTGSTTAAAGSVSFFVYFSSGGGAPTGCTGSGWEPAGTGTASGEGPVTGGSYVTPQAGTYYWRAAYAGDSLNQPASSPCTSATVVSDASLAVESVTPQSATATTGNGTRTLTITGTGFQNGDQVTFYGGRQGHEASTWVSVQTTNFVTSTQIEVIVTISTSTNAVGAYNVTVARLPSGPTATASGALTVT